MHTRSLGNKGEDIACTFLKSKGFIVADRNYQKKCGELDIVATKGKKIHFFEVKSVTYAGTTHTPEENVHGLKVRHIRRMVETYLADKKISSETEFQFHVVCVYMDISRRTARVKLIENVIL